MDGSHGRVRQETAQIEGTQPQQKQRNMIYSEKEAIRSVNYIINYTCNPRHRTGHALQNDADIVGNSLV